MKKVLFVASEGVIVAVSVDVFPLSSVRLVLFSFTPDTCTVTVTVHSALFVVSAEDNAVITAVPFLSAVILPF